MFDAFRERMGRRALASAVATRAARPLPDRPGDRSVLIVLPTTESDQRAAWRFVDAVDLPKSDLTLVVVSERVAYAPDKFAGSVKRVADKDLDWRGLPRAEVLIGLAGRADVAVNLAAPDELAAQFLVGTSPAAVRIGRHAAGLERSYDLMLAGAASTSELVDVLERTLRQLDPPILPLH